MGSQLQQVLRSLCFNTGWKYAVFWKLKHRAKMILTCEDAYYDHNQYPDKTCFNGTGAILDDSPYPQDPLALTVAKLSYEVYGLGEGVVGQVAVSGKHSWIFSDMDIIYSSSMPERFGGWQNQFSAGIKTIAVVPVIPNGVVQLGSLHKIAEDLKLVDHVRIAFSDLLNSLASCITNSMQSYPEYSCLSDTGAILSNSAGFDEDEMNLSSQVLSTLAKSSTHSHIFLQPESLSNKIVKMNMQEKSECSMPRNEISLPSSSKSILTRQQQEQGMEPLTDAKHGETNALKKLGKRPQITNMPSVENMRSDNSNQYNTTLPTFQEQSEFRVPQIPSMHLPQDFGKQISPFSVYAGNELYEALGASFQKQNDSIWETEKTCPDMAIEISEGMGSSSLLMDSSDMNLLDAVVAQVSSHNKENDTKSSILTSEKTSYMSMNAISSSGYSFDRETSTSFNSVTCGVGSLKGFSSPSSSRGSEHLDKPREMKNKKRARPGESCRPRPRDRQLIQDRIKELREMLPNGSKCSIDSLLERTIKHMLFLQSITKHADKLHKCSASKLLDKETGMRRFSSREQGSSWAVEVGTNSKVCPIIVENINMSGQMLVEMLCEESNQFLDIAETIRRLGLTILKGVSEPYGEKTWVCFVVEGPGNRSMHRMDVLWSLMQLLQPKLSEVINA